MNSAYKVLSIATLIIVTLFLFSSNASADSMSKEVHWPKITEGTESSPDLTLPISVKGPCTLVVIVYRYPYVHPIWPADQYCWDGHDNTIPPFPHGPGVSKSRYWVDGKLMPESFSTRDVREGSAFLSEVSFPLGEGTYKGTLIIRPPHRRNLAYAFQYQHAQYCKIAYVTYPPGTAVPWGQHGIELPTPTESPSDPSDVVNETKWSVNAHPVHWIFHTDGTVEAPGIWSGTWKKTGDEYRVNIIVRGVSDSFIVKFSSDGKSFTAYKNGKIYRNAIRVQ